MPKVKYGTEEYRNAYNKRSLANYDFNSKTYNLARPLPDIVATPKNNLDLGQVVRNGTSKIGKPIGVAITELAALHPREGVKAAKAARALFANRPYRVSGTLKLDKPIQTVGEVSNRAALTKSAEQMGADGVIFNNVYDNGYSNNQVIFSFKDLIDGITTKKAAGK